MIKRKNLLVTITLMSLLATILYMAFHYYNFMLNTANIANYGFAFSILVSAAFVAIAAYTKKMLLGFLIYQAAIYLLFDVMNVIIKLVTPEHLKWTSIYTGWLPLLLAAAICMYSYISARAIRIKRYGIGMDGLSQNLKIAMISDMHLGTNVSPKDFNRILGKVNALDADFIMLCGDIYEERTSDEEYRASLKAFAKMRARKGIYYVLGNHEYAAGKKGVLNLSRLGDDLRLAGVTMLRDDVVQNGGITIIGRDDMASANRKDFEKLINDDGQPVVVMDHRPCDFQSVSNLGASLHLSGHTHAGQLFPVSRLGEWFGQSELMYGHREYDGMHAIVSSGIGTWGFPMRLGVPSEIAVVELKTTA